MSAARAPPQRGMRRPDSHGRAAGECNFGARASRESRERSAPASLELKPRSANPPPFTAICVQPQPARHTWWSRDIYYKRSGAQAAADRGSSRRTSSAGARTDLLRMSRAAGPNRWALGGVLTGHILLGFAWLFVFVGAVFFTSSYTGGTDLVLLLGGFCWLVALPIIVIGWRSGSHWYWGVPVAWVTVFAIAALVVVGQSVSEATSTESGPPRPGTACPKRSARTRRAQPQAAGPSHGASLIAFESDRDGSFQIYVMNADGTDQRRLTRNATGGMSPAWSPDGTRIAFHRPCSYGNDRHDSAHEIFVMNADGSRQRNLTGTRSSSESPAWSPDGTRIAFVRPVYSRGGSSGFGIFVMNADGSRQRVLARNASVFGDPTWSPNGKQIAFAGIDLTIHVMNSDGSGQRRLTDTQADSESPAWSPVASRIAFTSSFGDANYAIYTMNPGGIAKRRLTHDNAGDPAWAPSGTKIAFASFRDGDTYEVYVMNADGSGQTRLTHNSAADSDPSWQPTPRRP